MSDKAHQTELVEQIVAAVAEKVIGKITPQLAAIEVRLGVIAGLLENQPTTRSTRSSGSSAASKAGASAAADGRPSYNNARIYLSSNCRDHPEFCERMEKEYPEKFAAAKATVVAEEDAKAPGKRRDDAMVRSAIGRGLWAAMDKGEQQKMKSEWEAYQNGAEIGKPATEPLTADTTTD